MVLVTGRSLSLCRTRGEGQVPPIHQTGGVLLTLASATAQQGALRTARSRYSLPGATNLSSNERMGMARPTRGGMGRREGAITMGVLD
jgi:hypothetical protein